MRGSAPVALLAGALALALAPGPASARRLILVVGDSTVLGVGPGGLGTASPATALRALLDATPRADPWRRARVVNYGLFGTATTHWLEVPHPESCAQLPPRRFRLLDHACTHRLAPADAVRPSLPRPPDVALLVLGINDAAVGRAPEVAADNVRDLVARLRPVPVLVSPPFPPPDPSRARWVERYRALLIARGLQSGPDWPAIETWDGVHPTEVGAAHAAARWRDALAAYRP